MRIEYTAPEREAMIVALKFVEHLAATDPRAAGLRPLYKVVMGREAQGDTDTPKARRETLAARMPELRQKLMEEMRK